MTLVLNPTIETRLIVRVRYRTKGGGWVETELDYPGKTTSAQGVVALVMAAAAEKGESLLTIEDVSIADEAEAQLRELGLLLEEEDVPGEAATDCDLVVELAASTDGLEVSINEATRAYEGVDSPYHGLTDRLGLGEGSLLVVHPSTGVEQPVTLSSEAQAWLRASDRGKVAAATARALERAGLVRAADAPTREGYVVRAAEALAQHKVAVLRGLINPHFSGALRRYAREVRREGEWSVGNLPTERRLIQHNEPVMQAVHGAITPLISAITERSYAACKASYSFFAIYHRGAILERHTDRPQCRWNLSLVLDVEPEAAEHDPWPIYAEAQGQEHEIRLGIGDGVLYSGVELPHWRHALEQADRVTCCFFHFVDLGFTGSLD